MEPKYNTNSFKKLLNRLQEDSWQLELLISAFAIFGLFYVIDPLKYLIDYSRFYDNEMAVIFYETILISVYILIFNLVLHVLLRALWIGSIGLRYVSGEIEFDKLNYSEKFTKYLKNKVGSFDAYISKLEDLSSVMFAISFLLIFYVMAFQIISYGIINTLNHIANISPDWINNAIKVFLLIFYVGSIITFIDFITQGLLKKNKWISIFYFPIYRFFSIVTLSFLYRPLVYNFLDNKFGRRLSMMLFPFYIAIFILSSLYYQSSNIIPLSSTFLSKENVANSRNYEDIVNKDKNLFIKLFAIQSQVITEPYVKIIIPLTKQIEDPLIKFNSSLKPEKEIRGYHTPITIRIGGLWNNLPKNKNNDSLRNVYLNTFNKYYSFKIDTLTYKTDFIITNIVNEGIGFETYISIRDLNEGKHFIEFKRLKHKDTDSLISILKVPFWYYKN